MSKKIYLNKSDSVASAIDKVINAPDEEVVLYIPRDAMVAKTGKDIQLLKREVEATGKSIIVESVDDEILELVATAGLRANNPFLGRSKQTVSDIVKVKPRGQAKTKSKKRASKPRKVRKKAEEVEVEVKATKTSKMKLGARRTPRINGDRGARKYTFAAFVTVLLTVLVTLAVTMLPRVSVTLSLEKMEHGFIGELKAAPSITENSVDDKTVNLRGVLLSKEKNITKSYPATGLDEVGRKARGTITIYNNFSNESQQLVKTTRFSTPDGKIYRIDYDVTVPGATGEGDDLSPSSIDVSVTADQPGPEYNIGPVEKFTIPGFQGSAKYEGFYGESTGDMTGGASGEVKVPTDEDIETARADATSSLSEVLKAEALVSLPEGIEILDNAYEVIITREQINDVVDKKGDFSITLYGEIKLIGFDESELVEALGARFSEEAGEELMNFSYEVDYGEVAIDFEKEMLSSAVNFDSEWIKPFDKGTFTENIAGMTENDLKKTVFSTPGVSQGEVDLWPFWVNRVPRDLDRITVDAN